MFNVSIYQTGAIVAGANVVHSSFQIFSLCFKSPLPPFFLGLSGGTLTEKIPHIER